MLDNAVYCKGRERVFYYKREVVVWVRKALREYYNVDNLKVVPHKKDIQFFT